MKPKAMVRYPEPGYPTQTEVAQNPNLMRRSLSRPIRRALETGISGAMAVLIPLSGCDRNPAKPTAGPSSQQVEGQDPNRTQTAVRPKPIPKTLLVAPIFQHGEGRGAIGCVVVSPPLFLSEEEGLTIIKEELIKRGISLENKAADSDAIRMNVNTDLLNESRQIIIEFISEGEYRDFGGPSSMSTVMSYDFLKVAQDFRSRLAAKADHGVYGIFYEPSVRFDFSKFKLPRWREKLYELEYKISTPAGKKNLNYQRNRYMKNRWKQIEKETKEEARDLLRKQVRDFAQWLADQKAL